MYVGAIQLLHLQQSFHLSIFLVKVGKGIDTYLSTLCIGHIIAFFVNSAFI